MNGGEEVAGELVVAGCDAPEVLEAAERALDGVAVLVERGREAGFVSAVRFRRDVGRCALRFDLAANLVAVIAFVAMQDLGLHIPDDVSLVGLDDSDWAEIVTPRLSVIEQPVYDIGRIAVERLVARINGDSSRPKDTVLPHAWIERESVARVNRRRRA